MERLNCLIMALYYISMCFWFYLGCFCRYVGYFCLYVGCFYLYVVNTPHNGKSTSIMTKAYPIITNAHNDEAHHIMTKAHRNTVWCHDKTVQAFHNLSTGTIFWGHVINESLAHRKTIFLTMFYLWLVNNYHRYLWYYFDFYITRHWIIIQISVAVNGFGFSTSKTSK